MKKYSIDIATLNKTCLAGASQLEDVKEGYVIFWSDKSAIDARQSGVCSAI